MSNLSARSNRPPASSFNPQARFFTIAGVLDLTSDPAAQATLEQVLQGNASQIPVLIADMNAHGTEYIQNYRVKRSFSTWGGEVNVGGGGGGAELNDGSSSACYDPPRVRQSGGPWNTATWQVGQTC